MGLMRVFFVLNESLEGSGGDEGLAVDRTCESLITMGEVEGLMGFVLEEEEEEDKEGDELAGFVEVGGGMEGG